MKTPAGWARLSEEGQTSARTVLGHTLHSQFPGPWLAPESMQEAEAGDRVDRGGDQRFSQGAPVPGDLGCGWGEETLQETSLRRLLLCKRPWSRLLTFVSMWG